MKNVINEPQSKGVKRLILLAKLGAASSQFVQETLGHDSRAVHRTHAKRALMKLPSPDDYEHRAPEKVEPGAWSRHRHRDGEEHQIKQRWQAVPGFYSGDRSFWFASN